MSAESEISTATPLGPSADPVAATYTVSGMTCGHCVAAVKERGRRHRRRAPR